MPGGLFRKKINKCNAYVRCRLISYSRLASLADSNQLALSGFRSPPLFTLFTVLVYLFLLLVEPITAPSIVSAVQTPTVATLLSC